MTERLHLTEKGKAVIESGLSLRQAHEIERGCSAEDLCAECRHYRDEEDTNG